MRTIPTRSSLPSGFVDLSRRIGANPLLTQGAGGNTSWKGPGDQLWVKASGRWLSDAAAPGVFVAMGLAPLREALVTEDGKGAGELLGAAGSAGQGRPSMETLLHVVMPHRIVAHVHSVAVLAHAVRADGAVRLGRLLDGLRWDWVPYAAPGVALGMAALAQRREEGDVLVLANHGLVIGADSPAELVELLEEVEDRVGVEPRPGAGGHPERLAGGPDGWGPADDRIHVLATDPATLALTQKGALFPDQVVFLGAEPPEVVSEEAYRRGGTTGSPVPYALVEGAGVVVAPTITPAAGATLLALALTLARVEAGAPLAPLVADDVRDLVESESEQYRQALDV